MRLDFFTGFILTASLFLFIGQVHGINSARTIVSSHFIINYNIADSSPAIRLSSDIENFYGIISGFLEIDPLEKFQLNITEKPGIIISESEFNHRRNIISVYAGGDYNRIKSELYDRLFTMFICKLMQTQNITSVIDKDLINALSRYPVTDRTIQNIMLDDLLHTADISSISLNNISAYNTLQKESIYSAFTEYIISTYGKKILIQSLKDTVYYKGLLNSITMITGDTYVKIETGFQEWLLSKKSACQAIKNDKVKLIHFSNEYYNSSYSISDNGQPAILQNRENQYRILIKNGNTEEIINLKKTESGSSFIEILFMGSSRIAAVETLLSGSKIVMYNIQGKKILKEIHLPHLFINDISYSEKEMFIFSALCGSNSDVYTFDLKTGYFNILSETRNNYSPIILNDKAYFISVKDKVSINELDLNTGKIISIFSSERGISNLTRVNNKSFTFTMNLDGVSTLYIMETETGNFSRVNPENIPVCKPVITGKLIYFLSFFKGGYSLFTYDYNF